MQVFKLGSSDMEQVSISEIYQIIKKLKTQTAPGLDQVHNILIKKLPFNFVKILQILSNLAIKTGAALYWKSAIITMIPKFFALFLFIYSNLIDRCSIFFISQIPMSKYRRVFKD